MRGVSILIGLMVVGKHSILHCTCVGGEELVEEAADELIDILLKRANGWLLLIFELVIFEMKGSLFHFLISALHILLIIDFDDLIVKAADALLVDAIIAFGIY